MNDFDKQLESAHSYKSYKAHFAPVYRGAQAVKVLLLFISCLFSAFFFARYFSFLGSYALYGGLFLSGLLAIIIGVTTQKALIYWSYQKVIEPLIGTILFLSIALNIYADFNGASTLGEKVIGEAPTDSKTAEISGIYSPQISSIDKEISDIEAKNFYWCATHKKAHKCEVANYYIDPKKDRLAVANIKGLKAHKMELVGTMNGLLKSNGTQYVEAINAHSVKVTESKNSMRFGSIVCTIFYILFSFWAHNYGLRAISETVSVKDTQPVKRTKKSKSKKEAFIFDEYREELTDEELEEELHAMRESEKRGK